MKKMTRKKKPTIVYKKPRENSSKALLYITGESPLVENFAEVCAGYGYDVCIAWNEPPSQRPAFQSPVIKLGATIPAHTSLAIELTNTNILFKKKNLEEIDKKLPGTAPILSSSITVTASEQATWIFKKASARRYIGTTDVYIQANDRSRTNHLQSQRNH